MQAGPPFTSTSTSPPQKKLNGNCRGIFKKLLLKKLMLQGWFLFWPLRHKGVHWDLTLHSFLACLLTTIKTATIDKEIVLVIFTFIVVFFTFPIHRTRMRLTLDLLVCNVGIWHFLVVVVYYWMQCFPQRLWWIKLKQNMHYNIVEGNAWHTTPEMLDRKYRKSYKRVFLHLNLVSELTPFLHPNVDMFVRPLVPLRK